MFDPFDILGLEKTYTLDLQVLEKAYFEAQKLTHPDRFALADEPKKREASRKASLVNQAYTLLKNPLTRAAFLLEDRGVSLLAYDLKFLHKVIEWHERHKEGENITLELVHEEEKLYGELERGLEKYDHEKARKALYRLNYVQKVRTNALTAC
ncbi:MAG: hypothetical protein ACD_16C00100G0086 [uncultured bacterium]|nr:MAG: hypothetical protein ACD_16C00100G0086 [uncultured bacterium]OFW68049.1 MAG: hypothetical protein A2X70_05010 [Alphaproteobacteria bacterium GWC2_42_16]OFW73442.1 MAG: hypothetical protein A2Z80_06310 [Alphaproteobacteria bacterium GWA2_41_27]OFW82290.1 MAG: hypothetical protein A3E50_03710 [Alphaproteobacteria bacterium RIFCSPHIGHO2_12_FULL_42_100]OFW86116.1 MAG: hypothetical protein A2W06_00640 [Alphaproteobacteria bacterium RBG_16_42_14]OFW91675.1 MAG: hypothetical protein A3C41_006